MEEYDLILEYLEDNGKKVRSIQLIWDSKKTYKGTQCLDDAWLTGLAAASKAMVDAAATAVSDKDDHESKWRRDEYCLTYC